MVHKLVSIVALLFIAGTGLFIAGKAGVNIPGTGSIDPRQMTLSSAMDNVSADPRNDGVTLKPRYLTMGSSVLVLDLKDVVGASRLDVFRVLWDFAERVMDTDFSEVYFVSDGVHRFTLSGADFRELGRLRKLGENPMYVIRTFPEKLKKPTGSGAFPQWTGGVLGVVGKQMEDFNNFVTQWVN